MGFKTYEGVVSCRYFKMESKINQSLSHIYVILLKFKFGALQVWFVSCKYNLFLLNKRKTILGANSENFMKADVIVQSE